LVNDEETMNKCFEELSSVIEEALAVSAAKHHPRDDTRPHLSASIQDEILLKNGLSRRWQVTRDPALKALVNRLQNCVTYQLNEWRNEQWSGELESSPQISLMVSSQTNLPIAVV
jgi:hypothetical protein